ncbi:MAG: T9SS C-terminal target domain-containing protein [Bacteroidetes bacterium]|nr:MAG: T9SS C-terminal target domain-containing protein [Bacteroidota bacterium]
MVKHLLTLTACLTVFSLAAQEHTYHQICGYDHYVRALESAYPGFYDATQAPFERVRAGAEARNLTVYTIPVVVHIVYQNQEQNLPDSLIAGVLDVLNQDYRRLNLDAELVREAFTDVVGDPHIEFELAGVERVESTASFQLDLLRGSLPDNVKQTATGGSDAWDTEHYLNIWVCNIEGGALLGYAYPPANLANWPAGANAPEPALDGVVIHHEVFRRTGTYTARGFLGLDETTIQLRGRTITHEVGHYLGLRHIWGDGPLAIFGFPDCSADDGVEDTPNQGLNSQFQCDATLNTCTDAGNDLPDMFENFMDYSQEDCLNSFTNGQIAIMRSVLENERSGLIQGLSSIDGPPQSLASWQVFPNPTRDRLQVRTTAKAGFAKQAFRLELLTSTGQVLQQWPQQSHHTTIELSLADIPAGFYHLRFVDASGQQHKAVLVLH